MSYHKEDAGRGEGREERGEGGEKGEGGERGERGVRGRVSSSRHSSQ